MGPWDGDVETPRKVGGAQEEIGGGVALGALGTGKERKGRRGFCFEVGRSFGDRAEVKVCSYDPSRPIQYRKGETGLENGAARGTKKGQ